MTSFRDTIASFADQMSTTAEVTRGRLRSGLVRDGMLDNVLFLGMGGSAVAAEIALVCAAPASRLPLAVVRDYEIPWYVTSRTLVVGVSHSGDTEETLQALGEARRRGAPVVAVTSGGRLAELAVEDADVLALPVYAGVMPRVALGSLVAACVVVLEAAGAFPAASEALERASEQLARRTLEVTNGASSAQEAAACAAATTPVIYGAGELGRVAAYRWKCDFNENAKMLAFSSGVPESSHNEICAWRPGDRSHSAIFLRHSYEHPRAAQRCRAMRSIIAESSSGVAEIAAAGDGRLAQLMDLACQGTWASVFAAEATGIEPEPIVAIERLKYELGGNRTPLAAAL